MNFFNGLWPGFLSKAKSVFGAFGYNTVTAATQFNNYHKDIEKINIVFSNPAVLKVFSLQCDLYSLGRISAEDKDKKFIENDPVVQRFSNPNPFQSKSQLLWDQMFFTMLGTDYFYIDSAIPDNAKNKLYNLDPSKLEWPYEMQNSSDKLIFSDAALKELKSKTITLRYADGTSFKFPLGKLVITTDLTNGVGNWFKGMSRLDALYKIISNSEHALDAKNINVRYSGKFLVGSSNQLNTVGLGDEEKKDIETKMEGDKKVFPLKTLIQIKRFVENLGNLKLDEAYLSDYFLIGNMYNIPRDVLEAYVSSTYENQEKARMSHVSYTLQPKGNDFLNSVERYFGYDVAKINLLITWDHLPFMQVFAKEKAEKNKIVVESLNLLLKEGVPLEQANEFLNTKFNIPPKEQTIGDNASPETLEAQAALRGSVGGVQGILAVQASVAQGTTTFEAALSILTIVYGFTDQQARDLLGTPTSNGETS